MMAFIKGKDQGKITLQPTKKENIKKLNNQTSYYIDLYMLNKAICIISA